MKVIEEKGVHPVFQGRLDRGTLNEARYRMADAVETGTQSIVGVNVFNEQAQDADIEIFKQAPEMQSNGSSTCGLQEEPEQEPVKKALDRSSIRSGTGRSGLDGTLMDAVIARALFKRSATPCGRHAISRFRIKENP